MIKNIFYMQQAINIAKFGLGNVGDNPSVGCVIVANNQIIGKGYTQRDGRHAEVMAVLMAKKVAKTFIKGSSVYVTLEPCSHFGRTPPCVDLLIQAKIAKIFIAVNDPDSRVSGQGIKMLINAGIIVKIGLLRQQAEQILLGFLNRIKKQKPYVSLKLAMSQDKYINYTNKSLKWITCLQSRKYTHLLRAQYDAILIGIKTALIDDPILNCRLNGLENQSPTRIILDSKLRIKIKSNIINTAKTIPTIIFTSIKNNISNKEKIKILNKKNIQIKYVKNLNNYLNLNHILNIISKLGINRLLVEGGAKIAINFFKYNLIDELNLFYSPNIIGKYNKSAIKIDINKLLLINNFIKISEKYFDIDKYQLWQK